MFNKDVEELKNKHLEELKNKHLEELKNKQTEMNNTITEMKNTLKVINSRITEAEERISDLEERMVEFTAVGQNKEKKNEKKMKTAYETSGTTLNSPTFSYRGPRRRRERERT